MVAALEGLPLKVRYGVICDRSWQTRAVHLGLRAGGPERALHLTVDDNRRWWIAGRELESLRDCTDVDLELTPATNTLPIRRLGLTPGESQDVPAAWMRFPGLTLEPLAQRYTRLEENRYRYESGHGAYVAEIEVDELGLATRYGEVWERVAAADDRGG